jgi:hypothetical protein
MERVGFNVAKNALIPASDEARAVMSKLAIGERVAVEVYRERNTKFSAKAQLVFERIGNVLNKRVRNVRGWVAAQTGRADIVVMNGKPVAVAWGTGPRDMNEMEFEAFWEDAKGVIEREILPMLSPDDATAISAMLN